MRSLRMSSILAIVGAVALGAATLAGAAEQAAVGTTTTVLEYDADAGELPEGVAVDKRGRIYVTMPFIGQLRRIDPRTFDEVLVATLPTGGGFGPLGLAVDARGDVYVGVVTLSAATQGVYRVTPEGTATRLPGTEAIGFANGLAFGDRGTLYVTDTMAGRVWRITKHGTAELWVESPLLVGDGSAAVPFPLGANGITYRQRVVYVTNTELGTIVAIPVQPDGDAGTPTVLVEHPALFGADGIAADVHGNLYVAVIVQSHVVRVASDGSGLMVIADGADGLDWVSSLAFGTGRGERTTVYAVNFSTGPFFGGARTWGPALVTIEAGVPGLPQP